MLFKNVLKVIFLFYITKACGQEVSSPCADTECSFVTVKLGEKTYLFYDTQELNWFEGKRWCQRQKASLAQIESAKDIILITDYLNSKNFTQTKPRFWIDYNDLGSEGTFYSAATGQVMTFGKWVEGQPDNWQNNEHCLHLTQNNPNALFLMNDTRCTAAYYFICEFKKIGY